MMFRCFLPGCVIASALAGQACSADSEPSSRAASTPEPRPDAGHVEPHLDAGHVEPPGGCPESNMRVLVPSTGRVEDCTAAQDRVTLDIAYGSHRDARLDVRLPAGAGPFPAVIWIHGGKWLEGDKGDVRQASGLVCHGYALASLNYRLSSTAEFPAQIHDVKAAIRFLREHASELDLDPERFVAFGSSAGGHLAALAGTSAGDTEMEGPSAATNVSSAVQAVVDWYGPTDFEEMDEHQIAQGCGGGIQHEHPESGESLLLGCTVGTWSCAAATREASPLSYVDGDEPPFLIMHGSEDCTVAFAQSLALRDTLGRHSTCPVMYSVTGAGHGGLAWLSPEVQGALVDFLDGVMRP